MTTLDQIAGKIIKEQELIIGPLAWEEASHVKGLHVIDQKAGSVSIDASADNRMAIDELVHKYEILFGKAARQVCKEAAVTLLADLAPADIPSSLR